MLIYLKRLFRIGLHCSLETGGGGEGGTRRRPRDGPLDRAVRARGEKRALAFPPRTPSPRAAPRTDRDRTMAAKTVYITFRVF